MLGSWLSLIVVVSVNSESGMVENVKVAAGTASPAPSVHELLFTSAFRGRDFEVPMSANAGPCRQCHI